MKLVVLTEYSSDIGFGHISRTMALADVFSESGWDVEYLIRCAKTFNVIFPYSYQLVEWANYDKYINQLLGANVVLIDTYRVSPDILNQISNITPWPITIVDSQLNHPNYGTLVFGSIYANEYALEGDFNVLSGKDYMLFRREFINASRNYNVRDEVKSIVVSLGKFIKESEMSIVLSSVSKIFKNSVDVHVVGTPIGFHNKFEKIHIHPFLETKQYVEMIQSSDLVISNGGQTLNECIVLNVPAIPLQIADSQKDNIKGWEAQGVILSPTLGDVYTEDIIEKLENQLLLMKSSNIRSRLSNLSKNAVDFNGANRVFKYMLNGIKSN